MNRKFSQLCLVVALTLTALSVRADNLRWLSREYDFGSFQEMLGPKSGQVQFINDGDEPTIINNVRPTCGCTVARFTEGEIMPGDTATIWFEYNPVGRPGRFEKHIKVYTGLANDLTSVVIRGTVIGSPETLRDKYPVEAGPVRLTDSRIALGNVTYPQARNEFINGYNQTTDTIRLSWEPTDRAISMGASSRKVAPGDLFTLSFYFNSRDLPGLGTVSLPVELHAGDADITLHITANVQPDTSKMSEQELRDAPAVMLYPTILDLGNVATGDKRKVEFGIKNDGKTPLHIKRIHAPQTEKAFRAKSQPRELKAGAAAPVKGEFTLPEDIPSGPFKLPIEVVTDDPLHPSALIYLIGTKE